MIDCNRMRLGVYQTTLENECFANFVLGFSWTTSRRRRSGRVSRQARRNVYSAGSQRYTSPHHGGMGAVFDRPRELAPADAAAFPKGGTSLPCCSSLSVLLLGCETGWSGDETQRRPARKPARTTLPTRTPAAGDGGQARERESERERRTGIAEERGDRIKYWGPILPLVLREYLLLLHHFWH